MGKGTNKGRAAKVARVLQAQDKHFDRSIRAFERELRTMLAAAQSLILTNILGRLAGMDSRVFQPKADAPHHMLTVLRQLDRITAAALANAGIDLLTREFVGGFNEAFAFFGELLDVLGLPKQQFGERALVLFGEQQLSAVEGLASTLDATANLMKSKALAGGVSHQVEQIAKMIDEEIGRAAVRAVTGAENFMVVFHRTVTSEGFRQIEQDLPKGSVRYRFEGPSDKLTRPFCKQLLAKTAAQPMTRAQIEKLDNGQLPNPFVTGGGWNCRHQWIIEPIRTPRRAKPSQTERIMTI